MSTPVQMTRRRLLKSTFAFSAAAALHGCGWGTTPGFNVQDPVVAVPSHFLMVGDWGTADTNADQNSVAAAMQGYVAKWKFDPDALLMLGDNFYGDLAGGANSPRWQTQFERTYPAGTFPGPAYAVPGNHDYQHAPLSKLDAELAYSTTAKSRWMMSSRYRRWTFPAEEPTVTFIALDSNMPNEKAQPIPPDSSYFTQTDDERQAQLLWLEAALAIKRTTPFLVVIAHHPLYSNGSHGDNQTLIRDWDPLFRKYKVDMYLAGHDHDLQHLEFAGHPTSFVISGGGGAELSPLKDTGRGPFGTQKHGFTHLQVTSELMTLRHLDESGSLLHKFTRTPDGTVANLK